MLAFVCATLVAAMAAHASQAAPLVMITSPADSAVTVGPAVPVEFDATGDGDLDVTCSVDAGSSQTCGSPFLAGGLSNGVHTVEVTATDALLETGSDSVTFTVDMLPPEVAISSPTAGAHLDTNSVTLDFTATDEHLSSVECSAAGGPFAACTSAVTFSGLSQGLNTFQVRALDLAGNMAVASVSVTIDTTAPSVTITSPADGAIFSTGSVNVGFTATDTNLNTVECSLDGAAFSACTSPLALTGLSEAAHTVVVRATDLAGNVGSDTVPFTVEGLPPVVTITSPTAGQHVASTSVTVNFTATDSDMQQVRCSIDGGNFMNCTSPRTYNGLAQGSHTVVVRAIDKSGLETTASVSFVVDTIAPVVSITSPTAGQQLTTDSANVTFSATDSNALTVTCNVDGAGFSPCASPLALSGLTQGSHTVVVRATDPAGNSVDASRTFFVDSIAPSVAISSPTDGQIFTSGNIPISFTANDANLQSVECRADAGVWAACVTGYTFINLAAGTRMVQVRATDLVGNVASASVSVTIDLADPMVTFSSPAAGAHIANTSASVVFSATDASLASVECEVDGGGFNACTSPLNLTGLSQGPHTVSVRATDTAARTTTASRSFTVDTVAPAVLISSPSDGAYFGTSSVPVSFSAIDANLATVTCSLDGGSFIACTSPRNYTGLLDGAHTVTVRAVDEAGNSAEAPIHFNVDTTDPAVAVSSPTQNQHLASANVNVAFTATDSSLASVECNVDGAGFNPCTSPLALTGLAQGPHTVVVRATDAVGRTTSVTRDFVVDTQTPTVSISSPANGAVFSSSTVPVSFSVTDANLASVTCSLDGGAFSACTSPRNYTSLSDANHTVTVRAADQAGNSADASVSFIVDTIDPAVTFSSPAAGAHVASSSVSVAFSATDTNLVSVECDVDSAGYTPCSSPLNLTGLAQGPHTVAVRATDIAGHVTTASRSFTVDTVAPSVSISSPTAGQFFSIDDIPIAFDATDSNLTSVQCRVDTGAYSNCAPGHVFSNLAEGTRILQVRATDQAGSSTTASVSVTIDLTDPAVSITSPGAGAHVANTSVNVAFTATDTNLTSVECNVDSAGFSPCTSPLVLTSLSQGVHTVVVRATDAAGRTTSASRSFTVDTVVPSVSISSPTSGQFFAVTTVPVSFSATDTNLTFVTCSIDGGAFSACTSPRSFAGLAQGGHTVVVRATDQAGNSADASVSFTVDTVDPSVSISFPTAGQHVASTSVGVAFSATDANALTVTCQVDGGGFTPCSSPLNLTGLSQGSHTVIVRAVDPAGNSFEVSRTFTVDTVTPSVSIISPTPGKYINSTTVSSDFSANDANGVTVTCRLDAGAFQPCTSPASASSLSQGDHTITVRAVDPAGNSAETSVTFKVDSIAPVVNVSAPTQNQHIATTSPNVLFTATDTNSLTVECDVDGDGFSSCASPLALNGLAQGAHTVVVRATDPAGNTTSITRNFIVDTIAPAVSITSPTANLFIPSTTVQVNFTATDTNLASVTCAIDGGSFSACTSPRSYTSLTEGDHTVVVRATDNAGNFTEDDVTFRVDTIAPALTIQSPANNSFINSTSVNVPFTTSDANADKVECRLDSDSFAACTSPFALSGLSQGSHTVQVRATDRARNATTRSVTFTVDTILPTVSISDPISGSFVDSTTVSASFTANDANALTIECQLDTGAFVGCASPASVNDVPQGAHTITVRATDPAGNTASAVTNITVDSIDPAVALSSPTANAYLGSDDVSVAFSATDLHLETVKCRLDAGTFEDCTSTFDLTALTDGAHTVTIEATDLAKNVTSISRSFTIDTIAPVVSITSPTANEFFGGGKPVVRNFSATDANLDNVQCSINGGAYSTCASGETLNLSDGDYTATVRATDRTGRMTSASVSFSVDRHVPTVTIDGSDGDFLNSASPTIDFVGADGGVPSTFLEYECSVDGGVAAACTAPFHTGPLTQGDHSLAVSVQDRAGNVAGDTFDFTVDSIAPAVAITSPSAGSFFAIDEVSKTFTRSDDHLDTVECRFDGGGFEPCTSPREYTGLSEGIHTSEVRATDRAGNQTTRSIQFTVDTIAPQLNITSPAAGQTVFGSDVAVAFNGVDATALSYECSANGGALAACGNPFTFGGLDDGGHSALIRATDRAGNNSETSVQFSVDLTSPDRSEQFGSAKPKGKTPLKVTKRSRLIFRDEFTGSTLNRRKWTNLRGTLKHPYSSAYNIKKEAATYARENVSIQNGRAVLTLKKKPDGEDPTNPYSSGMIHSGNHFSFQHGYVEARVLVPKCVGCWPAFWMLNAPVDEEWPPEIDIFEYFNTTKDKRPKVNFHWKAGNKNKKWGSKKYGDPKRSYVGGWHTYGLHWTSKKAQVFVDGRPGPVFKLSRNLPKKPNYLIFNLALQKGFNPTGERRMMIDYVRVWQ